VKVHPAYVSLPKGEPLLSADGNTAIAGGQVDNGGIGRLGSIGVAAMYGDGS
jgi:hypothetical protein